MLTAAGKTTETRVRGSVESNYRTAYDVLVRPKGAVLPPERKEGLVRNNYLSGLFGGITLDQYHEIKELPGVDVAAPVANIGYVIPIGTQLFELKSFLSRDAVQLYRVVLTSVAHDGTSRYPVGTSYVYYTRRNQFVVVGGAGAGFGEVVPGRAEPVRVCPGGLLFPSGTESSKTPFWPSEATSLTCYSARSPGYGSDRDRPGVIQSGAGIQFPILIAAIDPVEEARLLHLDRAIVRGRYLREAEMPRLQLLRGPGQTYHRLVPVIASTRTFVDEHVEARIERLSIPPRTNVPAELASKPLSFLTTLRAREMSRRTISAHALYDNALTGSLGRNGRSGKNLSWSYWTASPVGYRSFVESELVPRVVKNPLSVWRSSPTPGYTGYTAISKANDDLQFRRLHPRIGSPYFSRDDVPGGQVLETPTMWFVGRYDPEQLPGFSPLSKVPLETYYPPELLPADTRSKRELQGKPLLPSTNIGDYVAQPPLFLTTLEGMRPFLNPKYYSAANGRAPISVIRVRVEGVAGADSVSQARVRQVAAEIHDRTGLQVDITAGSSPRRLKVTLPPGKFGRPALLLEEGWSKKGVSLSFLTALDDKRLGLFSLILISCTFFLANGAFASVRGRRTEIGTLRCLGWPGRAIFGVVLAELLLIGALAGIAASGLAVGIAEALSLDLRLSRALLAIPLSLALTAVAGAIPAWRAARVVPMDAVRPTVSTGMTRGHVRHLALLAFMNVRRMPARTLAGAAGLFLGSFALTLLLAINQAFQGQLVGTLLGEVVSVQVRGLDFLVVAVIVLLAGLSLADVLYLNLRERAAEFVTLKTVGWSDRHLGRVIAGEAILLALVGSVPGAILGGVIGLLLGVGVLALLLGATVSIAGGIAVALLASLVPMAKLASLTAPSVLAEE